MDAVIVETFQLSQKSVQRHNQLANKLRKAHSGCKDPAQFNELFLKCLQHALVVFKREPAVERALDFAVRFALLTSGEQGERNVTSFLLKKMLALHSCRDKGVRMRSVEVVRKVLDKMDDDIELEMEICDEITDVMLVRLTDKLPTVRCHAVLALSRLQDPNDPECPVQQGFQKLLTDDSSPDVRRAVLAHIFVCADNIELVIGRTKDVKDTVRRTALEVLAQRVSIRSLTIAQRRQLLKHGLADRSDTVQQACRAQLLPAWLQQCDGDFVQYLQRLDVESCDEWVEKSTIVLMERSSPLELVENFLKRPECSRIVDSIRSQNNSNLDEARNLLDAEVAFYWRCLCQHLRGRGSSAEEQLDRVLPEGSCLCPFLSKIARDTQFTADGSDVVTRIFILQQLFKMASLLDLADEAGRRRLQGLVCELLVTDSMPETLVPALASCLRVVESSHEARMRLLLEVISDLHLPMTEQTMDADLLHQTMANMSLSVEHVPLEALLKCLLVLQELLQDIMQPSLSPALSSLADTLVLPCVQTADPIIREAAFRCLGLCCLLSLDFARHHFLLFLQAMEVDVEEVQKTTLKVVFDLLHTYGLNSFETDSGNDDGVDKESEVQAEEEDSSAQREVKKNNVASGILSAVSRYLDSQNEDLRHICMQGFAKLMLAGRLVSSKMLLRLFLLWFNPACDDDLLLRQTLAGFFPVFAFGSRFNQEQLGGILLPALSTIWQAPDNSPLASINVNDLTQLLIEFTDHRQLKGKTGVGADLQEQTVHEDIAIKVANKLLTEEDDIDERTLCRVLSLLVLTTSSSASDELLALDNQVQEVVGDKMALRYLAKFRANLSGSGKVSRVGKTPVSRMRPSTARKTTVTRTAVKLTKKKGRSVIESDDEDEDEEEVGEDAGASPVVTRQLPTRGCKGTKQTVEKKLTFGSSSEDESSEASDDDADLNE